MAEYVEREALIAELAKETIIAELAKGTIIPDDIYSKGIMTGLNHALKTVRNLHAADVYTEENVINAYTDGYSTGMEQGMAKVATNVVHGRWEEADDGDGVVCSICKDDFCSIIHETDRFKYCPNCGARMDGE